MDGRIGSLPGDAMTESFDALIIGTVKSRLFRGRRILQNQLREFAVRSGYVQEGSQ